MALIRNILSFLLGPGTFLLGKAVVIRIDDAGDNALANVVLKGKILDVLRGYETSGPNGSTRSKDLAALISLDEPLSTGHFEIRWLVVVPRHAGADLYTSCLRSITVYLVRLEQPSAPPELEWANIVALGSLKVQISPLQLFVAMQGPPADTR